MRIGIPAGRGRLAREAVARQRRDDDVEGVRGAAAMRGRIGQRLDDLQLLDDRAGPAVGDDHRQGVLMLRADVDEVDVQPVDLGDELRQGVQPRLAPCASRNRSPSSARAPASSRAARPGWRRRPFPVPAIASRAIRRRRSASSSSERLEAERPDRHAVGRMRRRVRAVDGIVFGHAVSPDLCGEPRARYETECTGRCRRREQLSAGRSCKVRGHDRSPGTGGRTLAARANRPPDRAYATGGRPTDASNGGRDWY